MSGRRRTRLVVAVGLLVCLVAAALPATAEPEADEPDGGAADAPVDVSGLDELALWERALPTIEPGSDAVEVARSANGVVWRGADGRLTSRLFSQPVNFQDGQGDWHAIDTRLEAAGGGSYSNRAGPVDVSFASKADAASVVTVRSGDASVGFGFAGATDRAEPVADSAVDIAGGEARNVAEFDNVLTSTSLRYELHASALKELIVLDATSAAARFSFPLTVSGLTPSQQPDGSVEFRDARDAVVFRVPAGIAYDSATSDADGTPRPPAIAPVETTLSQSADGWVLEVGADRAWLDDPERVFPVVIDPSLEWEGDASGDAWVIDGASGFDVTDDGGGTYVNYTGTIFNETWTFMRFDGLDALDGAQILDADWHAYTHGAATGTGFELRPVNGSWTAPTINGSNDPPVLSNTKSGTITSTSPQWRSLDITTWVTNWAANTWANNGVRLGTDQTLPASAVTWTASENATNQPYVDVTYNWIPTASDLQVNGVTTLQANKTNDATPALSVQVDDGDAQATGLYGKFEIWNNALTTLLHSGNGSSVGAGLRSSWTSPALMNGTTYKWRVAPHDGTTQGAWSSPWFTMVVDTTAPATPTASTSTWTQNAWNGAAPASGTFTFGNGGSGDVVGYWWGLDVGDDPDQYVAAGTNPTVTPGWGWHDLVVRSTDAAGNLSSARHYLFGQGSGGFVAPDDNARTTGTLEVDVQTSTSYDGIAIRWRESEAQSWQSVPHQDVTFASSGQPIGSWPVATSGGSPAREYPDLVWDVEGTTGKDGPVQTRIAFYQGSNQTSSLPDAYARELVVDRDAFGAAYASVPVGPGNVNLLTGNLTVTAADVALPGGMVSRVFQSRDPIASGGVFGPGWTSTSVLAAPYRSLTDQGDTVVVREIDGGLVAFRHQSDGAYVAEDGSDDLILTLCTTGSACRIDAPNRYELSLLDFVSYGFEMPAGGAEYLLTDVDTATLAGASSTVWEVVGGNARATRVVASPPAGVDCSMSPATTRGCVSLAFDYATTTTATGTAEAQWGDYAGRLRSVRYDAWDPAASGGAGAMVDLEVARYLYDSTGRLRAAWDPRISPALKVRYSYDTDGHLATVTPPGEEPWTFAYQPLSGEPAGTGRLRTVSRPSLPSGTATTTLVYGIPLTTATGGPYEMTGAEVARWGQQDLPVDATAVYPPDQLPSGSPPSSYERATVYYTNTDGQLVNIAQPGGYIATAEHDDIGNVIRELTPANRKRALDTGSTTAEEAAAAIERDTHHVYDADGILPLDSYGPAHTVELSDGTVRKARAHTHYVYDENKPDSETYDLLTTTSVSAAPIDGTAEQHTRTTKYEYAIGADTSGWTLGTPLRTVVAPSGLNLRTTTLYDTATGLLSQRQLPKDVAGTTAATTKYLYYTAGTHPVDSACGNRPEWANLLCKSLPAAQPGTAGHPDLHTTQVTKYDLYRQPAETVDTNGAQSRATTVVYDAGGRPWKHDVDATVGTDIPQVTTTYDSVTGRPTTTSDGTRTITRTYDTLGRMTAYEDADANTTTYDYDVLDRPVSIDDGKGAQTLTYDGGTERRGLPTSIVDSAAGTFSATYDADGQLATQAYPGGLTATFTYNTIGRPTKLAYTKGSGVWPTSTAVWSIHGQQKHATSAGGWANNYNYDGAGRLTKTDDLTPLGCRTRLFAYDDNTNRTSMTRRDGLLLGPCPTSGGTVTSYAVDPANRLIDTGYAYDALGRTTMVPAGHMLSSQPASLGYHVNDLVRTMTQGTTTLTYNLDPARRVRTWANSDDGQTRTHHYSNDSDSPAWTAESTAGTTWTRNIAGFAGLAAIQTNISGNGTIKLQLANIDGDIITTADTTDTTNDEAGLQVDPHGQTYAGTGNQRYEYLGSYQDSRDLTTGLLQIKGRLYNPATGRILQPDSARTPPMTRAVPAVPSSDFGVANSTAIDAGYASAQLREILCTAFVRGPNVIGDPVFGPLIYGAVDVICTETVTLGAIIAIFRSMRTPDGIRYSIVTIIGYVLTGSWFHMPIYSICAGPWSSSVTRRYIVGAILSATAPNTPPAPFLAFGSTRHLHCLT
jgi:YD repeat-containing protein